MSVAAENLLPLLERYWGYRQFRPLQGEAIRTVMEGRDSLTVLPTGGGKSLCFQVPAVALDGTAIVVSPLISLMKDQVDGLTELGIPAACLNSSLTPGQRMAAANGIRSGRLKLLYIAPERLCSEQTLGFLENCRISFFAIDEAHCISQWGHDFRKEYRMLGQLRERFPQTAVHAYTATATQQVRDDIVTQLALVDAQVRVGSFDRPNLTYRVELRNDLHRQVWDVLQRYRGESGIIYCLSRKRTEELAAELNERGVKASFYHAGLSDEDRHHVQEAFQRDEISVIVATVAFGMGIDKSNVRFVIHAGSPKSLEHYQQEAGRAGRDGLAAECCLIYSPGDLAFWRKTVSEAPPEAQAPAYASLDSMDEYCGGVVCRHRALVEHFDQEFESESCGACDVCLSGLDLAEDALVIGQKILSCVVRLKERMGADYTAQVLAGSQEQRILARGDHQLSTYGLLKSDGARVVRNWIEQLVSQGCLIRNGEYQTLAVTATGWEVLRGERTPRLLRPIVRKQASIRRSKPAGKDLSDVDSGLFEKLRRLRRTLADERTMAAYLVFNDAALAEMARFRPTTLENFRQISGVGEKKLADYGELFCLTILQYCQRAEMDHDLER